ncbi:MAG: LbtU family siderophore porin [Proteobacteria bacterium]|nr:LbtU family siderophore porin [Pseudomonadota bacterium]
MKKRIVTLAFLSALFSYQNAFAASYDFFNFKKAPPKNSLIAEERWDTFALINQAVLPTYGFLDGRLRVGAFGNVDVTPKTMQKTMPGEENNYFALSNVGANVDGDLNNWIHGHVGVAYYQTNKGQGDVNQSTGLMLDDAWAILGDYNKSPLFLQAGRFYLPFGLYDRYTITPTLPQMLAESRETAVQVGFLDWYGFSLSGYGGQGFVTQNGSKIQGDINTGASLLYQKNWNQFRFLAGVQYMYNMLNTNALREGGLYTTSPNTGITNVYTQRTDGIAVQLRGGYGPIDVFADYVSALRGSNNIALLRTDPSNPATAVPGAKPSAWDIGAAYHFTAWNKQFTIDGSYQRSYQSAGLYVFNAMPNHPFPQARYIIAGTVDLIKDMASIQIQWGHNYLYPVGQGDSGRQGDDATIRLSLRV